MGINVLSSLRMEYYAFRYLKRDGTFAGIEADLCADDAIAIARAIGLHDWATPGLVEVWRDSALIFTAEVGPVTAARVARVLRRGSREFVKSWEYLRGSYRQWREREQVEKTAAQSARDRGGVRKPDRPIDPVHLPPSAADAPASRHARQDAVEAGGQELLRVMTLCPSESRVIFTGMRVRSDVDLVGTHAVGCPHCGDLHSWTPSTAWLEYAVAPWRRPQEERESAQ